METNNNIELRSEELEDMLGKQPGWMIKWGITAALLVLVLMVVGSFVFKYPDTIKAPIIITTENLPATLMANSSGKISNLFVADKQLVKAGEMLAIVENTACYQDVIRVKKELEKYVISNEPSDFLIKPQVINLGELQSDYAAFIKCAVDYKTALTFKIPELRVNSVQQQILKYEELKIKLQSQCKTTHEQLLIAQKQYKRDSLLYANNAISGSDLERGEIAMLQARLSYENARANVENTGIAIDRLEEQKFSIHQLTDEKKFQLAMNMQQTATQLVGKIKIWEKNYVLYSPINGYVSLNTVFGENQNVKAGDAVMTVVPSKEEQIVGKVKIPFRNAAKVKPGLKVNIRLDNFVYTEFGMLNGKVNVVSQMPDNAGYAVEIVFPEGLKSSYGKSLTYSPNMQGNCEIVTDDIRLIERLFAPIKSLVVSQNN